MSDMNIDIGFISKLLETKDWSLVKDLQIKAYFLEGENKKVFSYLNEYYLKNGAVPTIRAFKKVFPKYNLEQYYSNEAEETVGTEEPLKYWCDELRKRTKHNKLADNMEKVYDKLSDFDTDGAFDILKKTVLYIENDIAETSSVDITQDTGNRLLAYKERKENDGIIGVPMGIDKLDFLLKGMQNKQLITMIAKTGIGKTWFECLVGAYCQLAGYRVLQFTTEMAEEQMQDRYEAILMGILYKEFNYSKFKSGKLDPEQEDKYFEFLENRLPNLEPLIIETATGVSNVAAKIDQHNPDVVFIDGAYLMEDDRGAKEDWLRVAHITRDLKSLAKLRKKPIFINTQADSNTSTKTGPALENIGFSKAIGHDSDVVLALFQDEQMREDREMKVKILKQREGVLGNVMLNWDFSTMDFSPIFSSADNSTKPSSGSTVINPE